MLNILLSMSIVWLIFGINIVRVNGTFSERVPTAFSRENLSTTLEPNDFVQHSLDLITDTKTEGIRDDNETSVCQCHYQMTNNTRTITSLTDDSITHFTESNESWTLDSNTESNGDTHFINMTNEKEWTTQPYLLVLGSGFDNVLSEEKKQLISKKTTGDLIFVFFFILEPLVAVAGCVCNTFNIIIIRKQGLSASTACYLLALTLADFTFLVFTLVAWMFAVLKNHSYPVYVQWATWMHHDLLNRFFVLITGRISNYFVAVLSIERFIAVRFPLSIKFTPLSQHPKQIITGVCVFVSALLVPNIFRTQFTQIQEPHINTTITKYTLTEFHNSNQEFYVYYTYFILAFLRLLPILVVFFSNLGIIIFLKVFGSYINTMNAGDKIHGVKQIKITRMLVAVAVIFLICILPGLVHSLLTVFYRPYFVDNQNLWEAVHHIYPLFDIINSTVNFIVYFILSEKFYTIFLNVFCRNHKKQDQMSSENNSEQGATLNTSV